MQFYTIVLYWITSSVPSPVERTTENIVLIQMKLLFKINLPISLLTIKCLPSVLEIHVDGFSIPSLAVIAIVIGWKYVRLPTIVPAAIFSDFRNVIKPGPFVKSHI